MKTLLTIAVALFSVTASAQTDKKSVVIGSLTTRPNALLIVNPQNSDQGVLLPQLTTGQRMSMKPSSPSEDGLIVFDRNVNSYFYWSNGGWAKIGTHGHDRYYSIDPVGFHELKPDNNIRHNNMVVFESDDSFVTAGLKGNGEEIAAPINIPHGAVLTEVAVYYMDNHKDDLKVRIMRKSFSSGSEEIVSWESSGASSTINTWSFTDFKGKESIDLENFTYRVVVEFDLDKDEEVDSPDEAKQRLYGIRIKYKE